MLQAINSGTISIADNINITTNTISLYVKDNGVITASGKITIRDNITAVKLETGTVTVKDLELEDNGIGIQVLGRGNELNFDNLTSVNNEYGIKAENISDININGNITFDGSDVAIYSTENSSITITGNVTGTANETLLQAENGSYVKITNDINISTNTIGLNAKDNSLISIANGTISYSTTAIKVEGSTLTGKDISIKNNVTGLLLSGENSFVELENLTGDNNDILMEADGGSITITKDINISTNITGMYAKDSGLISIENGTISYSTVAIQIEGGTVTGKNITVNNNETGLLLSGTGSKISFAKLTAKENEYGLKAENNAIAEINGEITLNENEIGIYSTENETITKF